MRTAIYVRVSTQEQAVEGYSISGQLKSLKAFCISQDWEVQDIYVDEGISAKDTDRPQLQKMISDIKQGEVDCVLVYRLDRLTRSVLDLYNLLEVFEEHDCKFKSATEVYDTTTAMGRLFITLVAALAQWERENMGERISFGFYEKAQQGKYPHNIEPMGYFIDRKTSKLVINELEAPTIETIFNKYLEGLGGNKLSKYLNHNNKLTKDKNEWTDVTLFKILKNPIYYGATKWKDLLVENTHEPIVTKEKWEEVQNTIKDRNLRPPQTISSPYIFSGKLKCPSCKGNLVGYYTNYENAKGIDVKYYNYRCGNNHRGRCNLPYTVSERRLEASFLEFIKDINSNNLIDKVVASEKPKTKPKINEEQLKKELEKISKRKKKFQYAWSEDMITNEDFKKRMQESNAEEEAIKEKLNSIVGDIEPIYNKGILKMALKNTAKNWKALNKIDKKNLVHSVIEQLHIEKIDDDIMINEIDFKYT